MSDEIKPNDDWPQFTHSPGLHADMIEADLIVAECDRKERLLNEATAKSEQSVPAFYARIYIAGDLSIIKQTCRMYCMEIGLCVTVQSTNYIYTAGEESGAVIGLINYARFPSSPDEIKQKAETLARRLMIACCQRSFSIVTPDESTYYQRSELDG